jgi:hypothetical protein
MPGNNILQEKNGRKQAYTHLLNWHFNSLTRQRKKLSGTPFDNLILIRDAAKTNQQSSRQT